MSEPSTLHLFAAAVSTASMSEFLRHIWAHVPRCRSRRLVYHVPDPRGQVTRGDVWFARLPDGRHIITRRKDDLEQILDSMGVVADCIDTCPWPGKVRT